MKITNTMQGISVVTGNSKQKSRNNKTKKSSSNSGHIRVHINFNSAGAMAQIANAKTKLQVASLERTFRAKLKEAVRYDSDENTIRAIKRVIGKAGVKRKALGKEERMENMKKVAASAHKHKEENRISEELSKKRRARMNREQAEVADFYGVTGKQKQRDTDDTYRRRFDDAEPEHMRNSFDMMCDGIEISSELQNVEAMASTAVDVCL